jgi:hypothetical protein
MLDEPIIDPVFEAEYIGFEGDTWDAFKLTILGSSIPLDLRSATARCQFKSQIHDTAALLTITQATGITLGNGRPNISIVLTPEQTRLLGEGLFYFDVELILAGVTKTRANCTLKLKQSVTQPATI